MQYNTIITVWRYRSTRKYVHQTISPSSSKNWHIQRVEKIKTQNLPSANGWPPSVSIFPFPKHILGEYSHCDPSTVGPSDGSRSSIHNGAAATWRLSTPRSLGILWIHRGVMKKLPLKLPILGDMRVGKQSSQGNMRSNWIISPGRGGNKK